MAELEQKQTQDRQSQSQDRQSQDRKSQQQSQSPRQPASGMRPGDEAAPGTPGTGEGLCPDCSGKGMINGKPCVTCDGTGKVIEAIGGA